MASATRAVPIKGSVYCISLRCNDMGRGGNDHAT